LTSQRSDTVVVWDWLVRVFHGAVLVLFALAYGVENDWPVVHAYIGYTLLLLIVFRLLWGFIGTSYARFSKFLTGPGQILHYLRGIARGPVHRYIGHNPAGGWMIVALLLSLLTTALLGIALFALEGSGPLAAVDVSNWPGPLLAQLHSLSADGIMALIVLHVGGVLLSSYRHRENLIMAMVSGRKAVDDNVRVLPLISWQRWWVGASLLVTILGFGLWGIFIQGRADFSDTSTELAGAEDYLEECGACHLAYPPGLLPAASWAQLLAGLEDHFGDNAELDSETIQVLARYLRGGALSPGQPSHSSRLLRNMPDPPPLRISELPQFQIDHRALFTAPDAQPSASQCAKCHRRAVTGDFTLL